MLSKETTDQIRKEASKELKIETILKILWALKDDSFFYFESYGKDIINSYVKQNLKSKLLDKEGLRKALSEIDTKVMQYHKLNGDNPAANHCRNIAIEALNQFK